MYKYNPLVQFITQLVISYGVFLFFKINPSFIILDFNLFSKYIPSGIVDTFISLKKAGGYELANSFLVVFLLNMLIYIFFIFLIIFLEWKFKKNYPNKKQDRETEFISNTIHIIVYIIVFIFVYLVTFEINIYNIPPIKGEACTRYRCYIGLFFWQNYVIWQSVSLFFMLMVAGLFYKLSTLINSFYKIYIKIR